MDDEFEGQIDQLLLEAEQRLQPNKPASSLASSVLIRPTKLETPAVSSKEPVSNSSLAVRDASKPILPSQVCTRSLFQFSYYPTKACDEE
jgi:hypothetical protein